MYKRAGVNFRGLGGGGVRPRPKPKPKPRKVKRKVRYGGSVDATYRRATRKPKNKNAVKYSKKPYKTRRR